jgi:hypothetical protein
MREATARHTQLDQPTTSCISSFEIERRSSIDAQQQPNHRQLLSTRVDRTNRALCANVWVWGYSDKLLLYL